LTRLSRIAALVVAVMLVAAPASAVDDRPEATDPCGLVNPSDVTATPWMDICSVDVDSAVGGDGTAVTVTVAVDGMVQDRLGTWYAADFEMGECQVYLSHQDSSSDLRPATRVQANCEPSRQVDCDVVFGTLGFSCFEASEPTVSTTTVATFTDTTITWTLSTAELPALAAHLGGGTTIRRIGAFAGSNTAGTILLEGRCSSRSGCTSTLGDYVTDFDAEHVVR
jgi:hypothetical protein